MKNAAGSCKLKQERRGNPRRGTNGEVAGQMKLKLNAAQESALRKFLDACEDAEQLSEREYVVDLYDIAKPVSLDLVFIKGGAAVDGAAELLYDEAQDGWYMGERLEAPEAVWAALSEAGVEGF